MQKCSTCKKAVATVHVMDLKEGSVVSSHYLCEACAESKGVVHSKQSTIQFSTEILENLLGGLKDKPGAKHKQQTSQGSTGESVCPACRMTAAEFKVRGRLGCPRCYEVFRPAIIPLLERVHDATTHRGRFPGRSARGAASPGNLAELRRKLNHAIEAERFEEAAQLRDELRKVEEARNEDKG